MASDGVTLLLPLAGIALLIILLWAVARICEFIDRSEYPDPEDRS